MPPGGSTAVYDNSFVSYTSDSTGCVTTSTYNIVFNYACGTTASTGTMTGLLSNQLMPNMGGMFGIQHWGNTYGGGGGAPRWEPVQAAALRKDWETFKTCWKRKRAEVKARRFFRRVVGDVAWRKFEEKGYHEIYGASRTRYRLPPAF